MVYVSFREFTPVALTTLITFAWQQLDTETVVHQKHQTAQVRRADGCRKECSVVFI